MAKTKTALGKVAGIVSDAAHSTIQAARTAVQSVTRAAEKAMQKKTAPKKSMHPAYTRRDVDAV